MRASEKEYGKLAGASHALLSCPLNSLALEVEFELLQRLVEKALKLSPWSEPVFEQDHVFDSLACGLELRDRENRGTMKHARRTA